MAAKDEIYKRVKIAGLISLIPTILVAAPLSGYFIGNYLQIRFGLSPYVTFIFAGIGLLAGIRETVRILKLVIKIEKDSDG